MCYSNYISSLLLHFCFVYKLVREGSWFFFLGTSKQTCISRTYIATVSSCIGSKVKGVFPDFLLVSLYIPQCGSRSQHAIRQGRVLHYTYIYIYTRYLILSRAYGTESPLAFWYIARHVWLAVAIYSRYIPTLDE